MSEDAGPERRCLVTGEVRPKAGLLRFVVSPEGRVVPDLAERLPGRGLWLTARRDIVAAAVKKRLFQRWARAAVIVDDDLAQRLEVLLVRRAIELIGLARRAGLGVQGFAKVEAALRNGRAAVLIEAADGAPDGRRKLRAMAPALPVISALSAAELGAAFGRDHAIHAAVAPGDLAQTLLIESERLGGFRAAGAANPGAERAQSAESIEDTTAELR